MSTRDDELIGVYDDEAPDYRPGPTYTISDDLDDYADDEPAARPAPRPQRRRGPNMDRAPRPADRRRPRPQVRREAEGDDTVQIDYRGHTYTVPADQDDWSIDALEAFERNHVVAGVRELLGPEQWARFKARHNNRRAFRGFLDEVSDVFGFGDAGN
ncbi:hypothetical protein [Tomitella fengzijianii]|uniref:Tail assembly chaperone n=1 Tax=Tomitella fengzijianii TaxID=2597660 RepID=A0A516X4Q0_9ACTN|nr:hypothetical protein [Tomitella fengzijianii]QDQ97983.1 hypothetical protein FO059_12485 [Tomitella fengzijianii]